MVKELLLLDDEQMDMAGILKISRFYCVTLLLLALTVRCIIPAGFMPGQTQDGLFAVVICTSMGPQTIHVDAANNPVTADQHNDDGARDCPFAPVLAQDSRDYAPQVPQQLLAYALRHRHSVEPLRLATHPQFYAAQGPPSFLI